MKIDVKESANKILANVEANERQVQAQIEQVEKQHAENSKKLEAMRGALKEMVVMKMLLIAVSTQPALAASVASLLESSNDPTMTFGSANVADPSIGHP